MAVGEVPDMEVEPQLYLAFLRLDQFVTECLLLTNPALDFNNDRLGIILSDIGNLMGLADDEVFALKSVLPSIIRLGSLPYIRPSLIDLILAGEALPYGEGRNGLNASINRDSAMDNILMAEPNDIARTLLSYLYGGEADYHGDLGLYAQFIGSPGVHETDLTHLSHHIKDAAVGHCVKCVNLIEALADDLDEVKPSVSAVLPRTADGEIPTVADFEAATEVLVQADAVHPPESLVTQACVHASATMFVRWVVQGIYNTDFPKEIHF